jgi:hypothetical protein
MTTWLIQYYKGRKIIESVKKTNRHDLYNALINEDHGHDKLMLTVLYDKEKPKDDRGLPNSLTEHSG